MAIAPQYRPLLIAAVALIVLPFVLFALGLTLTAATDVVILAIAAMALNILVGHTGLVSFGHGAFFGLAACAAALSQRNWFPGALVMPSLIAVAAVAAFAWLAGFLVLRRRGVYVALTTFALSALLFAITLRWTALTGGAAGLDDVVRPPVAGLDLAVPWIYYAVVALIGLIVAVLLWRFNRSPVGHVLVAIRENEQRARFIGYATDRYKLFAFTVSATITGIAGILAAFLHHSASAEAMSVSFSGALLAMAAIGGMRSFLGPALGALLFVLFRECLSIWTANWLLLFWLLFVLVVIFSPTGLVDLAERLYARLYKPATGPADAPVREVSQETSLPQALTRHAPHDGPVLIARELAKSFGGVRALAGCDIVVEDRTLHALVGPNGAGKTAICNLLSGMYPPDAGFITLAGRPVAGLKPETIVRAGMGRSFQIANLFGGLTVQENLRLAVQARHRKRFSCWNPAEDVAEITAETATLIEFIGLAGMGHVEAASLSNEERRLLDIGLALATAPRILLLDEPLAGLAAAEGARVAALVKSISQQIPVLLVDHDIDRVLPLTDVVTVLDDGKVLVHGDAEIARNDARRREAYTGSGTAHLKAQASAAGATTLLKVEKVDTFHGKSRILDAVSLDVAAHEIVALLGRNGAGKSTLLKTLIGITPAETGSITLADEETTRLTSAEIARRGIGYVPQGRGLFAGMTVADNLAIGRRERTTGAGVHWDDERIIWVFPRLARRWYTPVDDLSGGERQIVAVARALAGDVRLLLLDEPFEGLSGAITEELFEAFDRLRYEVAMVLADNRLDLALALSDRAVILDHGAVTWTGASRLLRDDTGLRRQKLWM